MKQQSFLSKLFQALFQPMIDWVNSRTSRRSTESLLLEDELNAHQRFAGSYEQLKSAGGNIQMVLNQLAVQENLLKGVQARAIQAARAASTQTDPAQKAIADKKVLAIKKEEAALMQVVAIMRAKAKAVGGVQDQVREGTVLAEIQSQADLAESRGEATLEALYMTLENVSDAQLAAAGHLTNGGNVSHKAEISNRRAKAQGRAEEAQRMVEALVGATTAGAGDFTEEELAMLAGAYQDAGKTYQPQTNSAPAETATSVGA